MVDQREAFKALTAGKKLRGIMKGKIDKNGCLWMTRADGMPKYMLCCYAKGRDNLNCGDLCPHFGEPIKRMSLTLRPYVSSVDPMEMKPAVKDKSRKLYEGEETGITILELCHGKVLEFTEFIDERKEITE